MRRTGLVALRRRGSSQIRDRLQWQADSKPLSHQGSPYRYFNPFFACSEEERQCSVLIPQVLIPGVALVHIKPVISTVRKFFSCPVVFFFLILVFVYINVTHSEGLKSLFCLICHLFTPVL